MADTERTKAELLAIFAEGQPEGSIDPQDMRDFVVTDDIVNTRFSTGFITGGEVTINAGDPAKVDIAAGEGFYADNTTDPLNPVRLKVSWTTFTAVTLSGIGTGPLTFIGLDLSSGSAVVVQQPTDWTFAQRRDILTLALIGHTDLVVINQIAPMYSFALGERLLTEDLILAIGDINVFGNIFEANGANLNIDKTSGQVFSFGANFLVSKKSPNYVDTPGLVPVTFQYVFRDGSGGFTFGSPTTTIDPDSFDDGSGTLATVGNNRFTTQRIYYFPQGDATLIHYGQEDYATLLGAENALNTEIFERLPSLRTGFRCWLIVKKGITELNDVSEAKFIAAGKFGDVVRP